jgi:outer membrane protein
MMDMRNTMVSFLFAPVGVRLGRAADAAFLTACLLGGALGAPASAQTTPPPSSTLRLTADEAVRMALDNNVDLAADRLDPQIGDTRVAAASSLFKPTFNSVFQRNNQLQPPASFLIPSPTRTDLVTSTVGLSQRLPWFGTSYSISWDASHTDSNSFLNSYNPLMRSGLSVSVSQPLLRDLFTDASRQQLAVSRQGRDIANTRLSESVVRTTANVKSAYWNLASATAHVTARRASLQLAEELARVNQAKVDVGMSPPLDLLAAQAEVAANQEQLIIAETAVRQAEDRLRMLIFDPAERDTWNVQIEPIDSPSVARVGVDLDVAVSGALRDRADLVRARKEVETADLNVRFTGNQRLPDVRLNASYQANGLGGTEVLRTGGFPGSIVGGGQQTGFGSILDQLIRSEYPTWAVGVSVSYPIGGSAEEAGHARARLERTQAEQRVKSAEARVIQQVRDAAWKIDMNAKRIDTTRAARTLAEQRLDAERKRFEVGMSTSFLVVQAQRDLAQATTNELAAVLAYNLALVDFEALQLAGPASASASGSTSAAAAVPVPVGAGAARPTTTAASGVPVF